MILNINIELIQTRLSFKNLRIYITKSKIRIKIHYVLTSRLLVNVIWLTRNEVLNNNIVFTIQLIWFYFKIRTQMLYLMF